MNPMLIRTVIAQDAYSSFISWFKLSHTGLSPATISVNAASIPVLAMMYGMKFDKGLADHVFDAYRFLGGTNTAKFIANSGMLDKGSEWARFMKENPAAFTNTFGLSPKYAVGRQFVDDIMNTSRDMGISISTDRATAIGQLDDVLREASDELKAIMAEPEATSKAGKLVDLVQGSKIKASPAPSEVAFDQLSSGSNVGGATWGGSEFIDDNGLRKFSQKVAERAQTDGGYWKALDAVLNKSMENYQRIDQAGRLGIAARLTKDGITERELVTMGRITEFDQGSIVSKYFDKNGEQRFRISPEKATEISSDILLNYAAMPPAIRMLRSLPILGAPFASFMYGMALRTAQTMASNPASFNKIAFALNSVSGEKSPLERKALNEPYYKWYNEPTMVRLPFFDKYPIYLNTANVLPYYTLNMFQPAERTYKDSLPADVVSAIDKSPIFKDPIGQMMLDYFIIPSMIRDSRPLNSFGAPLYPTDATALEKTGYAARAAVDVVTPGVIGAPVGLAAGLVAPESATYLPGYRTRQMAQAVQGKSAIGVEGKESASSRTLRALSGYLGAPVQRMDTRVSDDKKK